MREAHVGDLIVVEENGSHRVPVGMITDRDIVVGVVAKEVTEFAKLAVGDVLLGELVIARSDEDLSDALGRMRRHGIRRIPVVDKQGNLEGIFTLDDLLAVLTHDLESVVRLLARQAEHERQTRV
jgi:CBS domain-containing protein